MFSMHRQISQSFLENEHSRLQQLLFACQSEADHYPHFEAVVEDCHYHLAHCFVAQIAFHHENPDAHLNHFYLVLMPCQLT